MRVVAAVFGYQLNLLSLIATQFPVRRHGYINARLKVSVSYLLAFARESLLLLNVLEKSDC